jgi:gamma-glutamyl:cysteine ligase YbdK (ATP-grasp superfamily)
MQSVLEITTPVCRTAGEVADSLRTLRSYVAEIARK